MPLIEKQLNYHKLWGTLSYFCWAGGFISTSTIKFTSTRSLARYKTTKSQRSGGHGSKRGVKLGLVFGRDTWLGLET